jgi:predicted Zn-ribbon and HTH transcriptional regulator
MKKLSLQEIVSIFDSLEYGEMYPVVCEPHQMERLEHTKEGFTYTAVKNTTDTFIIKRVRVSARSVIQAACRDCGFDEVRLDVTVPARYVRNLVSQFNSANGRSVRVRARGRAIYIYDDIEGRERITEAEFEAYRVAMLRKVEAMRSRIEGVSVDQVAPQTEVEGIEEKAVNAVEVIPMQEYQCMECGEDVLLYPHEMKLCDMCRGID